MLWFIIGVIAFISVGVYCLCRAVDSLPIFPRLHYYRWARKHDPGCVKLSFNQFKEFYLLAPNKWEVPIKTFKECSQWEREYQMPSYERHYNTVFFKTYRDYRRAMQWLIKYKKAANKTNYQLEEYKNTAAFMKLIQRDINKAQEEANRTADNTEKQIEKILENMKEWKVTK